MQIPVTPLEVLAWSLLILAGLTAPLLVASLLYHAFEIVSAWLRGRPNGRR